MSITIAGIFAKAWRREQFGRGQRLLRGATWFVLYLMMIALRERIALRDDHTGAIRALLFVAALVPVWYFGRSHRFSWSARAGGAWRYLALAGLAGVVIDEPFSRSPPGSSSRRCSAVGAGWARSVSRWH